MADIANLKEDLVEINAVADVLVTSLDEIKAAIAALKEQIANGTGVTQADLDELDSLTEGAKAKLADVKTKADEAKA